MNQRMIVSWIFRVGALLLGGPALIGLFQVLMFLFLGAQIVHQAPAYPWLDIQKYGIAGMVWNSGTLFTGMFQMLAALGMVIAVLFAFALVMAIVLATLFFFTGVGVAHRAGWSRIMGIALCAICLVFWIAGLRDDQMANVAFSAAGAAISGYTIWVLGWRYT